MRCGDGDVPYRHLRRLDPKSPRDLADRAWAYVKVGRTSNALADVELALEVQPNVATVLNIRGHVFEALGKREEAIADVRLSINPNLKSSKDALTRLGTSQ